MFPGVAPCERASRNTARALTPSKKPEQINEFDPHVGHPLFESHRINPSAQTPIGVASWRIVHNMCPGIGREGSVLPRNTLTGFAVCNYARDVIFLIAPSEGENVLEECILQGLGR